MAKLKFPKQSPVGGWPYRQMDTGFVAEGDSLEAVVKVVIAHRKHLGLTPTDEPTVRAEVERQYCARMGLRDCRAEPGDDWVPQPDRPRASITNILAFSQAAIAWLGTGREMVEMSELKRRAEICRKCVLNQNLAGCKCARFYKAIEKAIPAERREPGLGYCLACECSLVAKTNLPKSIIDAGNEGKNYPYVATCWQRER